MRFRSLRETVDGDVAAADRTFMAPMEPFHLPSVVDVLKPAVGPSSSHTLGPMRAGLRFRHELERCAQGSSGARLTVTMYGSLAHTGRGHLSDLAVVCGLSGHGPEAIANRSMRSIYNEVASAGRLPLPRGTLVFRPDEDVRFDTETPSRPHPNTLRFAVRDDEERVVRSSLFCSIGGGALVGADELHSLDTGRSTSSTAARDLLTACEQSGRSLADHALALEETVHGRPRDEVVDQLDRIWSLMRSSIDRGLRTEGVLPGRLGVERRAAAMLQRWGSTRGTPSVGSGEFTLASIYAIAVAEENADGGAVVTAPTCGSAGVLPACLRVTQDALRVSNREIVDGLLVAGAIGGLAIAKASIAGALVGCQGEIGIAAAMAAAAVCHLLGGSVADQIDRAAETALEHFLGLTCDPVAGLVQIPCIERNAAGAVSGLNAANLARVTGGRDRVSFDATLEAMHRTGLDLRSRYKETSLGGLAAIPDLDRDGRPDDEHLKTAN